MMDKEEDDKIDTGSCLSSEIQAIELEFIKAYERLPILWDVNHPDYTNKYRRGYASDKLLKILKNLDNKATRLTVRQKINVLRSCYRKDLRKLSASKTIGPNGEEIFEYTPKNWKFYALKFLGGKCVDEEVDHNKNNSIVEINLDNASFEDEEVGELSIEDESSSQVSDVLQTLSDNKTQTELIANKERKRKKRMKVEIQDYFVDDSMLDKEFDAVGANVACKLKRMNSDQRCHAELLINKVLIEGLKNNLNDNTDLVEVYK